MFERLFDNARTIALHASAPYAAERERFLELRAIRGYRRQCLKQTAFMLLRIVHEFWDHHELRISEESVLAAARRAARGQRGIRTIRAFPSFRRIFIREAERWLRFLGRFQEPSVKPLPFADLLDDFACWMERERGLSPATVETRRLYIGAFLRWFGDKKRSISSLRLADIDAYQAACKTSGTSRLSIRNNTNAVRAFLRYAGSRGWCSASIADGIHGPRIYAQESLPAGPSWDEIRRLVSCLDTDDAADIRDRAIILLFSVYGLRSSEVSRLRLEDIDWEHDQMTVRQYKTRHAQPYPLVPAVGNAIVRYLKDVRPKCKHREIFITSVAPLQPMSKTSLNGMVARRMKSLGIISLPHHGPHALRHACASHLLSERFTLKEIGDHLGHSNPASTRIYAKVDLSGLREVAAFDLGGVL